MISNVQINFFNLNSNIKSNFNDSILQKKKVQIKLVKLKMKIIQTYIK